MTSLKDFLIGGSAGSGGDTLGAFMSWAEGAGFTLYPAQEEALLEVMAGSNVIVSTPTGSGKSLVALGAHFSAIRNGQRSFYTAPIKALVSEKFFDLCHELGSEQVGMLTGDAAVNPGAPVICCTAEVLANMALREGADLGVDQVVMDEFHFYADPDRGWAWQVPLLELPRCQFILMSATLGDVRRFQVDLTRRTGRPTAVVATATRPVPLDYTWSRTPVHATVESLLEAGQAPIYIVHFTQASAVERAQALTSIKVATRAERDLIAGEIAEFRFAPGFGRTLSRFIRAGIGVHHAGMLPKYRRLVERLAQQGLLKVICGTDTLGVGINVPIRTVLLTGLSKYDGTIGRVLSAREFHQITGRAGRAGFDVAGSVVVQAPEHVIETEQALAKAGDDPAKRRKVVRAKPPRRFVPYNEDTFHRLINAPPEPLVSSFTVSHAMLLNVLDRPGDAFVAMRRLLTDNDETRPAQRRHIRQAIAMYRSLQSSGVVERLDQPDEWGRRTRVTADLQSDFALNQPLSPFILHALPALDAAAVTHTLDVLSVVESTLDDPRVVLAAQLDKLKTEAMQQMKADGVEYDERIAMLETMEYPKPLREFTYDLFDVYRLIHPWAADHNIHPKSVVRDMFERGMGFGEYIAFYGLARSEGTVLRYLSDAYKALVQAVPETDKTDDVLDLTEWLGELVRQVDSSLLDEWELLRHPAEMVSLVDAGRPASEPTQAPVTANVRAFTVMVRNAMFRRVELVARRDWPTLGQVDAGAKWNAERWEEETDRYFAEHTDVGIDHDARAVSLFQVERLPLTWRVRQVLDDPAGDHDWAIVVEVDLAASDEAGEPIVRPVGIEQL